MKAKKITSLLLATACAFTMVACGGGSGDTASTAPAADGAATEVAPDASVEEQMAAAGIQAANTETGNTQTTDETLVVELSALPDFLWHPGVGQNGSNEEQIINAAFLDRLIDYDEAKNEAVPMLAKSWEWTDDTHLKLALRDDVTMTDGTPFVADDVVYTVGVWIANCAENDTGKYLVGAEAEDEHTVTLEFNCKAPDIIKMLSWANFGIVSEDEINAL
ncbi:MAG: ABC transporter substrate-binding protein, partial [Bacteroidaceae bacterium]|nr:ABC transporter substrate-binding protein [Bacteroidaceae bacterium]